MKFHRASSATPPPAPPATPASPATPATPATPTCSAPSLSRLAALENLEPRLMLAADVYISEFLAENFAGLADGDGDNPDWIELHNAGDQAADLTGWSLTDEDDEMDKWQLPAVTLDPGEYLVIFASDKDRDDPAGELHTNFKLAANGEYLALSDSDGVVISEFASKYPQQYEDISYGLYEGGFHYFSSPSPNAPNSGVFPIVQDVEFSVEHGIFTGPSQAFQLELSTPTDDAVIWYTFDGDDPLDASGSRVQYSSALTIDRTRSVRAAATRSGFQSSDLMTQTYIFLSSVLEQADDQSALGFPETWYNNNGSTNVSNPAGYVSPADYEMDPDVDLLPSDLMDIPSIALTFTAEDLFDPDIGMYVNPIQQASTNPLWEKYTSVEIIDPTGSVDSYTANAGARMFGELARWVICNRKESFRLVFREEYGPNEMETNLFDGSNVDEYNTVILRAGWGDSWLKDPTLGDNPDYPAFVSGNPTNSQLIRDQFAHDLFAATGQEDVEGRFINLYVNGLYWGVYCAIERPDNDFCSEHWGGEDEDWDIIKAAVGYRDTNGILVDGNRDNWDYLFSFFDFENGSNTTNVSTITNEDYGTIQQYLDVENLCDYMITICFIGRYDFPGKNWYVSGRHGADGEVPIEPFRFFMWDSEASLGSTGSNRTGLGSSSSDDTGPVRLYKRLRTNEEFRLLFADRLQKHFFNDGAMTTANTQALYADLAGEIDRAIVGESARWGDYSTPYNDDPLTREGYWVPERDRILNDYLGGRTATVLQQFRDAGLFPDLDAAQFNQHGGLVSPDFSLTINAATGATIYYTTDGSDPRIPAEYDPGTVSTLISENAAKTVLIPTVANAGDTLGSSWLYSGFDDSSWIYGTGGVGYDTGSGYDDLFDIDVQDEMQNVNTSAFIRIPFNLSPGDLLNLDTMNLGVRCDDGFVAYLNGVKIAETNNNPDAVDGIPDWDNDAITYSNESQSVTLLSWSVSGYLDALQVGANVLAIHALNSGAGSSDMLMSVELEVGSGGSVTVGGAPSPTAQVYDGAIALGESSEVKVRVYDGNEWSALTAATFVIDTTADLAISEINYHPVNPSAAELAVDPAFTDDDFEFVEIVNTGSQSVSLAELVFSDGIAFDFSSSAISSLAPGEFAVVVKNLSAFQTRYGSLIPVAGVYSGSLSNSGEKLVLSDDLGNVIAQFKYDDSGSWPGRPDGNGSTLEIIDPAADPDDSANWRSSSEYGGTPGSSGTGAIDDVVINELLTHTDIPQLDSIELKNISDQAVDIGGWMITDDLDEFDKFVIPANTILQPGEYIVFDEDDFNVGGLGMGLDGAYGEDVWLMRGDGQPDSFADHVDVGAAVNGESFGRYPDGTGRLYPMASLTLGQPNSDVRVGDVVISEIMYNPTGLVNLPDTTLIDGSFTSSSDGFSYFDDVLLTHEPAAANGFVAGGMLTVSTGSVVGSAASGGWVKSFTLVEDGIVEISLDASLTAAAVAALGQYAQLVVEIDGIAVGLTEEYLIQLDSSTGTDSGTLHFDLSCELDAGQHQLMLGVYLSESLSSSDMFIGRFDNVTVTAAADPQDYEFIEIYNPGETSMWLGGWQLDGAVDFDFADMSITPGQTLVVVPFDPADTEDAADFRSVYGLDTSVTLVGPYDGKLDNSGERLYLLRPDVPPLDDPDYYPMLIVDEVKYSPLSPWPVEAAGTGESINRSLPDIFGDTASSWLSDEPSPGSVAFGLPADFNGDGTVNLDDFIILKQNYGRTDALPSEGDANGDAKVNLDDFIVLKQTYGQSVASVAEAAPTTPATPAESTAVEMLAEIEAEPQTAPAPTLDLNMLGRLGATVDLVALAPAVPDIPELLAR